MSIRLAVAYATQTSQSSVNSAEIHDLHENRKNWLTSASSKCPIWINPKISKTTRKIHYVFYFSVHLVSGFLTSGVQCCAVYTHANTYMRAAHRPLQYTCNGEFFVVRSGWCVFLSNLHFHTFHKTANFTLLLSFSHCVYSIHNMDEWSKRRRVECCVLCKIAHKWVCAVLPMWDCVCVLMITRFYAFHFCRAVVHSEHGEKGNTLRVARTAMVRQVLHIAFVRVFNVSVSVCVSERFTELVEACAAIQMRYCIDQEDDIQWNWERRREIETRRREQEREPLETPDTGRQIN